MKAWWILGALAAAACSSHPSSSGNGDAISLASGVVVMSSTTTADVTVLPDRLMFPSATHPDVLSQQPGAILVGDRAPEGLASSINPRGFLRKVVSVGQSGDQIVVTTSPATLLDAVHEGSFEVTLQVPPLGATGPLPQDGAATLHPLGTAGKTISLVDLSGKTLFESKASVPIGKDSVGYDALVKLATATLTFSPRIDYGAKIVADLGDPLSSLQELHVIATGTLAADLELEAKLSLTGTPSDADLAQLVAQQVFKTASSTLVEYPVDLGKVGLGPISMPASAEFKVTVACDQVRWGGASDVVFGGKANASITAGFRYDPSSGLTPVSSHDETMQIVGPNWTLNDEVAAHCWIQPELDLSFFDLASGKIWADAWGAMSAEALCGSQHQATGQLQGTAFAGVSATAEAQVDILGLFKWQKQCTLFAEESPRESVQASFALPGGHATCSTPSPAPTPIKIDSPPASCFGGGSGDAGAVSDDDGATSAGDGGEQTDDGSSAASTDAATIDAPSESGEAGACSHDACTAGAPLSSACTDPCVQAICAGDSFCCDVMNGGAWDGTCIRDVTGGRYPACDGRTCP